MFFTYILRSTSDNKYYIGQTNNIEKRLNRHNTGSVPATKSRTPFELITYFTFDTRAEAMKYEKYLKSLKGGVTFQKIVVEAVGHPAMAGHA